MTDFTSIRTRDLVGPINRKRGKNSREDYCIWVESTRNWVYTQKYVERFIAELKTAEGFEKALGKEAVKKLYSIAAVVA